MSGKYEFAFAWENPYGLMARLLESHVPRGQLVFDLGCGYGAIAEPLVELGYEYIGCDTDSSSLQSLRERGFETHQIDLTDLDGLAERLTKMVAERSVGALLMLDVLEHLPDLRGFLAELRSCLVKLERPLLGLSIPNVGHYDVGAKLVMGSWDVMPAGLLDETHLQFFTERRLTCVLRRGGWLEVARRDLLLHHSDQHFPVDHPALADGTPLRNLLWRLRRRVGDGLTVNQFVRLFALTSADVVPLDEPVSPTASPFLSVLVRTRGARMHNLLEALTCLAAQTDDDLEVHLLVHSSRHEVVDEVNRLVASFAPSFAGRVGVHQVTDGGRARPLNVGLGAAAGRYVAFLDDDDLVTADWAERFRAGAQSAPGEIVRSVTVDRKVVRNLDERLLAPYHAVSGLVATHNPQFNALEHLSRNRTPICSFAVPMEAVLSLGISFDEEAAVLEDWNFLLNLALVCGVHDTGVVTSVYHRWEGAEGSAGAVDTLVWETTHRSIVQRLDTGPLLLPTGSASQIATLWEKALVFDDRMPRLEVERSELASELESARRTAHEHGRAAHERGVSLEEVRARLAALEAAHDELVEEHFALERAAHLARKDADDMRRSTTWRVTAPVRAAAGLARKLRGGRRQLSDGS